MRALVLAVLTVFATNVAQHSYDAMQAAVLADWWAKYDRGVVEKEAVLRAKIEGQK